MPIVFRPSPKLLFWQGRLKWDTLKGENHPPDVHNAGKDGGRVQLHQDGQEDVRNALFHEQLAPIRPFLAVFPVKNAYQTTRLGVVIEGKGWGTGRVDMLLGWPPCPGRLQLQTLWRGGLLTGKMVFQRDKCWQKLLPLYSWALWMSAYLSGWPPVLIDSISRLHGRRASWQGRW